jgi:hypothetical protein
MKRCYLCRKIVWFWQLRLAVQSADLRLVRGWLHLKCHLKNDP